LKNNIYVEKLEHKFKVNMEKYINKYSKNILFNKKIETYQKYFEVRNEINQEKIKLLSNKIFDSKNLIISYGGIVNHNPEIQTIVKNNQEVCN